MLQMPPRQRNLLIAAVVGLLVAFMIYSGYREAPWSARRYWGTVAGGGLGSAVVVFIPQIAMLFMFLAILEDSGYLARAAFLMDKFLSKVGLHG